MKYLLVCLLASFSVFNASATVYYVDSKLTSTCKNSYSIANRSCTGSDGTAYSTLGEAAASAVSGDTVFIREGVYNQQLAPKNSGTESAPITFKNYQQEVALLTGAALKPAFLKMQFCRVICVAPSTLIQCVTLATVSPSMMM